MAKSPEASRQPPGPTPGDGPETSAPEGPHPLQQPDERKEGGPDFGKAAGQLEKQERAARDGARDQHPRLRRKPGGAA